MTALKGRTNFVLMFALLQFVIGFQLGYIMCYTNQINPALNAKFGWDDHQATINESIIGSIATVALMISASVSGQIIQRGRRQALIISAFVGMLGTGITMIQNFWAIVIGRFIYGLSVGMIAIAMPRLMEETVPNRLVGLFGSLYCLTFAVATLIAYALAVFLPPDEGHDEELIETHVTQVVFGLPIVFYLIQLLMQVTYFNQDSVKFLLL